MAIKVELVTSSVAAPTFAAAAPGVAGELYITERYTGRVVSLDLGTNQVSAQAFFDVPAVEMSSSGEGGLLGLAFHPDYAANGKAYLHLTNEAGDNEIWEITRSAGNPALADPASARVLMTIDRTATTHIGGWIGFGPDGLLYIASGDSGTGGDPENAAQDVNDLRGKMLRIDVNSDAFPEDAARNYAIPEGNPFENEVFAYGLRNPWRASFDRATGDLYIGDVGERSREEIDFLAAGTGAGTNFGWRVMEGTLATGYPQLDNPPANDPGFTPPIYEYGRDEGGTVIGGYVYRGPGGLQGEYFFADFLSDHVWSARVVNGEVVEVTQRDAELVFVNGGTIDMIVSFGEDAQGRLYMIGLDGEVFRLSPSSEPRPNPGSVINGTSGNDNLTGTSGDDTLNGLGGNDTLVGSGGNDFYDGGTGSDTLDVRETSAGVAVSFAEGTISGGFSGTFVNIERVLGSNGADNLIGAAGAQNFSARKGDDTLAGGAGIDTLWGGGGADSFVFREFGTANADRVSDFASGLDKLVLDASVMSALGASGNFAAGDTRFAANSSGTAQAADDRVIFNTTTKQVLYDADGNGSGAPLLLATLQSGATLVASDIVVEDRSRGQVINGTSGHDTLSGTEGDDTIDGLEGQDQLFGGSGDDRLLGGDDFDWLFGEDGDDTMLGGSGPDNFFQARFSGTGPGNDVIDGGDGDDALRYDGAFDPAFFGSAQSAVVVNLANGTATGGGANGAGSASLLSIEFVIGTAFGDLLIGDGASNSLSGMAGADALDGAAGTDWLTGGMGADTFVLAATPGAANRDTFEDFQPGVDKIRLDAIVMPALGPSGNFVADDPRFYAADGATSGNDADDRVVYDTFSGLLYYDADGSGAGAAQVIATLQIPDASFPPPELAATDIEVVNGTPSGNVINGTSGNDSLAGTPDEDAISGLGGDDTLDGVGGNDTLAGGGESDRFLFTVSPGTENADSITDFTTGVDKIVLDGTVHSNAGASGNFAAADVRFHSHAGANVAHDGDQRVLYDSATGELWYDADGSGAAPVQLVATLQGASALAASDISIVNGTSSANVINGTSGPDTLSGTAGDDIINGLGGNDLFLAGSTGGADTIDGGVDRDSIEFKERATSAVVVDFDAGTITGGSSGTISFSNVERVVGGNFNDRLTGNAASQNLTGQAGSDTLAGAAGADTLWGGGGADTFIFREMGTANADRISDWSSGLDKAALDDAAFTAIGATGNFAAGDGRFVANSSGTAQDGGDRVVFNTSTGALYYDADGSGSGAAQLIATVQSGATVVATDIVVI